jgi:hypothetical protein
LTTVLPIADMTSTDVGLADEVKCFAHIAPTRGRTILGTGSGGCHFDFFTHFLPTGAKSAHDASNGYGRVPDCQPQGGGYKNSLRGSDHRSEGNEQSDYRDDQPATVIAPPQLPSSGRCITRSRLPTRANEDRQKEAHRRQAAKLARHHHAQSRRIFGLRRSSRFARKLRP